MQRAQAQVDRLLQQIFNGIQPELLLLISKLENSYQQYKQRGLNIALEAK